MPSGKKRKRSKMSVHKRKKRLRKNRHKKKQFFSIYILLKINKKNKLKNGNITKFVLSAVSSRLFRDKKQTVNERLINIIMKI